MANNGVNSQNRGHQLIVEPEGNHAESDDFSSSFENSVEENKNELIHATRAFGDPNSFQVATDIVKEFRPIPWFVWRLTNFVFTQDKSRSDLPEGFVLGLRRLLFATASDTVFGESTKVNSLRQALQILEPEVVGAVSAIHAMCRRLHGMPNSRIWRPILDDALVRTRIGYLVGYAQPEFGAGYGMLAGFVGRIGFAILIATGSQDLAREALTMLSVGKDASEVGEDLYGCNPLYVGAMVLSSISCGGNASLGMLSYLATNPWGTVSNTQQEYWLATHSVVEAIRQGDTNLADQKSWELMNLSDSGVQEKIISESRTYIRRDHGLSWLI